MGKLQNVVIINGKEYSVDTGKLLNDQKKEADLTAVKPTVTKAVAHASEVKRLINNGKPLDLRRPQQVAHHPHHIDLRAKKAAAKPLKLVTLDNFAKPAEASDLAHHVTHKRPKSIKSHKPAAAVHTKVHTPAKDSHQRIPRPQSPRISHVAIAHHTKSAKAAARPALTVGTSSHDARRLRAAQHRRNDKISKFAAARRNYATAPPKAEIKETIIKIDRQANATHTDLQARLASSQTALAANIAKHHPRNKKNIQHQINTVQLAEATKDAPKAAAVHISFLERIGLANKFAPVMATSLVALILVGYITYLNMPNLALRVAANRAGFDASMPAYTPEGFGFDGPIAYNSGQITIDFRSKTGDNRAYSLSQRKSSWNSESLLENIVKPKDDEYLTFQNRGLTIYVYDSQATWVNGGVWYTINSDSSHLNSEQLVKIASSL